MGSITIDQLRERVRGTVTTADDPSYDDARTVMNVMIDKRPRAVVRCVNAGDVMATVGWPITTTRGFGTVGVARPMCTHCAGVVAVTRGPGMTLLQMIVSAPLLMVMVGPIMMIDDPLPLSM